jgi:hypothetical protein
MFEPSVNQISSAYLGNPGALQAKVQQEQKASPGLPPDLRDLLALQDIQQQQAAYQRQQAMSQQNPPTVAQQLMQSVQQPAPQAVPQGMPQGAPQGIAQGMPQPMPMQRPGIQQLPSNMGQHMAGGGIVAFAEGGDEGLSERDQLRRMEAAYDPAVTEALNKANTVPPAYTMPAELIQRARDIEARGLNLNPEQAEAEAVRKYQAQVGSRDLSQYDRLIAEYENRKKQLEAPKAGMDALLEYLGQVAATPRGRTWMESGSTAARSQNELNAQRQAQQFELTKQAIDAAQKKADITFGEKKDLFGMGRAAYDQAYKVNYETALSVTKNAFEAEKLAKQMTDSQLNRENNLLMERERGKTTLAAANAPGQSERVTNKILALEKIGTPQALAEAKRLQEVFTTMTGSGAAGVGAAKNLTRQLEVTIRDLEKTVNPITNPTGTPEEREQAKAQLAVARQRLAVLSGIVQEEAGAPSATPVTTPPPPPGFVKQ